MISTGYVKLDPAGFESERESVLTRVYLGRRLSGEEVRRVVRGD